LGSEVKVQLGIYDLQGRLIRLLVESVKSAGCYTTFWDGRDEEGRKVPSGVYLYRLRAAEFSQSRKMVLMK
jgi:flagellar hook assembly protein FlgD